MHRFAYATWLLGSLFVMGNADRSTSHGAPWQADPELVAKFERDRPDYLASEERVPAYELPAWEPSMSAPEGRRRLRELFEQHVYGQAVPTPDRLAVDVVSRDEQALEGKAVKTRLRLTVHWGERRFSFPCIVVAPQGPPRPVFVLIHNRQPELIDPPDEQYDDFWPVDQIVARGYATAAFQHDHVAPDDNDAFRQGVLAVTVPEGPRAADASGALSAWAWGASRVLDALEQCSLADVKQAAVIGHSRGGKTALWAGALDERFGLVISNNSGCGGAALSRRAFGEHVRAITDRFPYWFCPRFAEYAGREAALPVDQHQLVGLIAPRAVYVASADRDLWADPRGEWLGLVHAAPAYHAQGRQALEPTDEMPALDQPVRRGPTGYHIRQGEHDLSGYDWQQYLEMADRPETWGDAAPAADEASATSSLRGARPNVLLILCDDMGWSDLGCYGGEIDTPQLDRLAQQGMRFAQFYNNAKCTTTRVSLLTGLYPRPRKNADDLLGRNMVTLGEALGASGYQTALCGKWHLGRDSETHPLDRGFDSFYGLLDGCCNYFDPAQADPSYKGGRQRFFARERERLTEFPEGFYTTDAFTDAAIAAVERMAHQDRPFFLHLCYTAPHYPLHAKPADIAKYRGKYRAGWDAVRRARFARQIEQGLVGADWRLAPADSRAYAWETADHDFEDLRMAVYAAMVETMDRNVGRLLAALEAQGIADDTLVLFLSDNGGCAEEPGGRDPAERRPGPADDYAAVGPAWGWAQNAPFRRYKVWMHEGGIRTPLIARWPGKIPAGAITDQPGHILDMMPTLLELAGGTYPRAYEGRAILPAEGASLVPVLAGEQRTVPAQWCWHYNGNAAIRQGDWKLAWDKLVGRWELYDLSRDPTELQDLAAEDPHRVAQLASAYAQWAAETGNRVPRGARAARAGS